MHLLNDSTRLVRRNQPVPSGQTTMNPGDYEAWHKTARGSWIADREFDLMMRLLEPPAGATLLDDQGAAAGAVVRLAARGVAVGAGGRICRGRRPAARGSAMSSGRGPAGRLVPARPIPARDAIRALRFSGLEHAWML